jgi:hypothetical protein
VWRIDFPPTPLLIAMRIKNLLSCAGAIAVAAACNLSAQQTVTDQYGTEILMDALPPNVQVDVQQTQAILDTGGGTGPMAVDNLGRFRLEESMDATTGASQGELLVNQLLGVVLVPRPGTSTTASMPSATSIVGFIPI